MDQRRTAWVLVGLALDAAAVVAIVMMLLPRLLVPSGSFFSGLFDVLIRNALVGMALLVVHGAVLPGLVWPQRRIELRDVGYAAIIVGSTGVVLALSTFFTSMVGILLPMGPGRSGAGVLTFLLMAVAIPCWVR